MFHPRLPVAAAAGFFTAALIYGSGSLAQSARKPAGSQPPHAHGAASLQVVADGELLTLELYSPLDNLVGFERAPRNDKEKAAVRRMAERLRKTELVFVPTAGARCSSVSVTLQSPVLDVSLLSGKGKPEPLPAQSEREAQKSSGPVEEGGHAALSGTFTFRCEQPGRLQDLEVKLFDGFPDLRRLDVQVVGPRGQKAAKLSSTARRISW